MTWTRRPRPLPAAVRQSLWNVFLTRIEQVLGFLHEEHSMGEVSKSRVPYS